MFKSIADLYHDIQLKQFARNEAYLNALAPLKALKILNL